MSKMFKKLLSLALVAVMVFSMTTTAFASSNDFNSVIEQHATEIEQALEDIMDYSTYDNLTGTWILDHSIVEDGIFTEEQYDNAEEAGNLWAEVESKYGVSSAKTRALPALLVVAIKAVAAIAGATVVEQMTSYFLNWGLSAGCKKFQKYGPIKSFCKANGFL